MITHLSSKKYLCNPVSTDYEARLLLEKTVGIADWNQSEEKLIQTKIADEFRKCLQTVRQELNMQLETAIQQSSMPDYLVEDCLNEFQDEEYPILRTALLYAFKIVDKSSDLA